jgi:NitT/TauT family transport system substrate-binding protein
MGPKAAEPSKRKLSNYTVAVLLAVAAALLAGVYVWRARTSLSYPTGPLEQVRIANTGYAGTCPVIVAQENGYFEREGVRVALQTYTTGKAALDATLRGEADLGTSAELPIMFAAMKGQPVAVIATIFVAEKDYGIVGRRDREIVTPASLKGKRIGVTYKTSGHFVLDAFLNRHKLSTGDVDMRDLKPEDLAGAIANGDIDAASTWEPYLGTMREQLRDNATSFSVEGVYDSLYNITGTRNYVVDHPETIKKVLRALIRGGQYCKETPDAAREILAKIIKTDATKLKGLWPSYRFGVTLDQGLLLALEDQTRWAIKNRLTERTDMPNYLNYVYLDGLQAVMPAAMTVIH